MTSVRVIVATGHGVAESRPLCIGCYNYVERVAVLGGDIAGNAGYQFCPKCLQVAANALVPATTPGLETRVEELAKRVSGLEVSRAAPPPAHGGLYEEVLATREPAAHPIPPIVLQRVRDALNLVIKGDERAPLLARDALASLDATRGAK